MQKQVIYTDIDFHPDNLDRNTLNSFIKVQPRCAFAAWVHASYRYEKPTGALILHAVSTLLYAELGECDIDKKQS